MAFSPRLVGVRSKRRFAPFAMPFTTAGTFTQAIPVGATVVKIEGIGAGGKGGTNNGGGGGAYAQKTAYVIPAGITALYVVVPAGPGGDAIVRETDAAGTILMLAQGGAVSGSGASAAGLAASSTGDIKNNGGLGGSAGSSDGSGGGAGNTNGAGGSGTGSGSNGAAGTGTAPAGAGNQLYGGGGAAGGNGKQGWAQLTFS